jgi:catechol 2,3-dioxygenase
VSSTTNTISFYRDVLGFALMAQLGSQAAFLSAGGYHHHIGANTWESEGALAAPEGTVRLRHATIVLPDEAARALVLDRVLRSGQEPRDTPVGPMVEDPSGNLLLLATASI